VAAPCHDDTPNKIDDDNPDEPQRLKIKLSSDAPWWWGRSTCGSTTPRSSEVAWPLTWAPPSRTRTCDLGIRRGSHDVTNALTSTSVYRRHTDASLAAARLTSSCHDSCHGSRSSRVLDGACSAACRVRRPVACPEVFVGGRARAVHRRLLAAAPFSLIDKDNHGNQCAQNWPHREHEASGTVSTTRSR
jgi:hypothetical protein